MSANVTVDMVKSIDISSSCLESYPCQHDCNVVLHDGREARATVSGQNVDSIIKVIACDKIKCSWPNDHFSYPMAKKDEADDILTRIFNP